MKWAHRISEHLFFKKSLFPHLKLFYYKIIWNINIFIIFIYGLTKHTFGKNVYNYSSRTFAELIANKHSQTWSKTDTLVIGAINNAVTLLSPLERWEANKSGSLYTSVFDNTPKKLTIYEAKNEKQWSLEWFHLKYGRNIILIRLDNQNCVLNVNKFQ